MKLYILMSGQIGDCQGYPHAAFKSKKDVRKYIKKHHPYIRGINRMEPNELYWEDELGSWFRCDDEIHLIKDIDAWRE